MIHHIKDILGISRLIQKLIHWLDMIMMWTYSWDNPRISLDLGHVSY